MKSLKIAIIVLFSASVFASCESAEIAPSDNFSVVVPETRDFENIGGAKDEVENREAAQTPHTKPVTGLPGMGISKEAVLITD